MPIPTPISGESQQDYVERAHRALVTEFPDTDQRNAVIFKTWRKHKGESAEEKKAYERFGEPDKDGYSKGQDGEYKHLQDIPVFKEHSYVRVLRDKQGNPVRDNDGNVVQRVEHYDLKALKSIVENCNRRVRETKDFAPITAIHTGKRKPDGSIELPEVMGFGGPFELGMYGNEERDDGEPFKGRWAIYNKEWWFKDKAHRAREMPRRSVEVFVGRPIHDRFLDPITALGAETPALDLGIHYHLNTKGDLVEQYSAPNMTVRYASQEENEDKAEGYSPTSPQAGIARGASLRAHLSSKKMAGFLEEYPEIKEHMDETHKLGTHAKTLAQHAKAADKHYEAQEIHHFHAGEDGGGVEKQHQAASRAHFEAYKAHALASGLTQTYQAAAMPGASSVAVPKEVGNKTQYDDDDMDYFKGVREYHANEAKRHREAAESEQDQKKKAKHLKFAGFHDRESGSYGKLEMSPKIAADSQIGSDLRRHFQEALTEVLKDKYEADPETVNACVNALMETQPYKRILAFLDANDAPVNMQNKMGGMPGGQVQDQQQPGMPGPEGEHSPAPGESPDEGEEEEVGPRGEQDEDGSPDPDTEGDDHMADDKGKTPPAPKEDKDKFELQEFLRDQKVFRDEMTARYERQQVEIEDLRQNNARLTGERNLAVRTQKVMDLRRVYAFNDREFIAKYSQASEEIFQTALDVLVNSAEKMPMGTRIFTPPMDLPEGAEDQIERHSQLGGATQSEAEQIVQYQLKKQVEGEYLSYDEAKEKWEEKQERREKKAAKKAATA